MKVKDNYDKRSSVTYKINYRHKFFDEDDTLQWDATCKLIRETTDTLFGGQIWFLTTDGFERYYDLSNIYLIDHSKKKITEYRAHEHQTFIITGNTAGSVIKINFLRTDKLLSDLKDTANKATLSADSEHFIVTIKYADKDDISEMERNLWIRKDYFVIDKLTFKVKFQGDYQYSEWNLSEIEFDKISTTDLEKSVNSYNKSYTVEQYVPLSEKDYATLPAGISAPYFRGTNFQNGNEISLNDYKGKFVILDFFYMSCMPCIKAIPHLVKLQNEYGNKNVVVLAVDSKDREEKSKKRLYEFITKNSVNYPIILTTYKTDSLYNVKAYPTLYAIDKKGKIVYSQIGFSEELGDTLKKIIDRQMK